MDDLNDVVNSVIAPEALMPSQWADLWGDRKLTTEAQLALAVIQDALRIIEDKPHEHQVRAMRLYQEAYDWLHDESEHVCSLRWWMSFTGIDYEAFRHRLRMGRTIHIERPSRLGPQLRVSARRVRR